MNTRISATTEDVDPEVDTGLVRSARLDQEILRESILSRCRQARPAFLAMILNTGLTVPLLGRGLEPLPLAIWLVIMTILLLLRYRVARSAQAHMPGTPASLGRYDRQFRALSVLSQTNTGAGIWLGYGSGVEIAPYVLTMLVAIYGAGTMVNLAHDYRSLRLSMPLLMGQPILYWLMQGPSGAVIAVILTGVTWMMISSSRTSMETFAESIRIRFEKDRVVEQLEQQERSTQAALRMAEAANRAKSFFMAAASHDLRQPLYAATLLNDTISLHPHAPETMALVMQQRLALQAAAVMFDNLLDLSKFESGVIEPHVRDVPLAELFAQLDAEFRTGALEKGLQFDIAAAAPTVRSDYDLLMRLLRNLISNAIRYTNRGGIRVRTRIEGARCAIEVADTGKGIARADQERVFQEFVQIDNPQRARDMGVGLGLSIVRHIAQLLEHELAIDSEPGRGTTITMCLPVTDRQTVAATDASAGPSAAAPIVSRTVWVVEDDPLVREALRAYLERQGCRYAAASGRAELRALEARDGLPDAVIFDDMLGGGESGLELAQWLNGRLPAQRIVICTGNADNDRLRAIAAAGFPVMRKPVASAALNDWLVSLAPLSNESPQS